MIDDEDGILTDLNIDSLAYRDGRLYATGSSYGYDDAGSHVLMNFAPDGSDFQYTLLMGGSLEDVISMSIGEDGNYYIARVSYDSDSVGFTGTEENAEQPGGEVPAEEEVPAEIQALLDARAAARKERNWAESDRLRDEIAAAGWAVKDSKDGQTVTRR